MFRQVVLTIGVALSFIGSASAEQILPVFFGAFISEGQDGALQYLVIPALSDDDPARNAGWQEALPIRFSGPKRQSLTTLTTDGSLGRAELLSIEAEPSGCDGLATMRGGVFDRLQQDFIASTKPIAAARRQSLKTDDPILISGVKDYLDDNDIRDVDFRITRSFTADLDSDGVMEGIVEVESLARDPGWDKGYFISMVAVGALHADRFDVEDHYGFMSKPSDSDYHHGSLKLFELASIEGDGHSVVVMFESGYEWTAFRFATWQGRKLHQNYSAGCGS
jgi:hypothetical protein